MRRGTTTALATAAGFALGIAITVGPSALRGEPAASGPPRGAQDVQLVTSPDNEPPGSLGQAARASSPAASPQGAVEAFLEAERARDWETSFLLLSGADRARFRSPAGWVAAHPNALPPVTGYDVQGVAGDGDRAEVMAVTGFEPSLDPFAGLVPARTQATWVVTAEDGGWLVALGDSRFRPLHPAEDAATDTVRDWVAARQDCRSDAALEHHNLLGVPSLADGLCGAGGPVEVGDVERLRAIDAGTLLAAYGESVTDWARTVPVTAPTNLRAVLAPIGQDWVVIAVLVGSDRSPR
ncbi:MAG TPA: hypothetical protein VM324_12405 [Egibacteraceae bacterium]|nr:hypothetical protein [Egibacteraceae bacterium]